MLVWGHWRLGRNRLCIYPLPVFFASRCWFKSSPGNARQKKNFWSSSHKMHIYSVMLNKGGVIITLTQTLWAPGVGAAFPEFVSKKICFFLETSFCLLPLASTLASSFGSFLYLVCLLASLLSPLRSLFFLYWLYIKKVLHTTARCDWSESMLQSNRLLIWPTSAADT